MAVVFLVGMAAADFVLSVQEFPDAAEKYQATQAHIVGGGCAANAAVGVARLGGEAILATRLGSDPLAELIVAELALEGVQTGLVHRSPQGRSSFSSILIDANGERQIVNFRGSGLTEDTDWLKQAPAADAVLVDSRWSHGALVALKLARSRAIPGVLDAEAPVDPGLLAQASHVAFSSQGLRTLTGEPDLVAALKAVRAQVNGWACVTDGANGIYFLSGSQVENVPAFVVQARDTLAAGDIWHGAFTLCLAEGTDERTAVEFANAAAALKCLKFGGRSGCPSRRETENFLREQAV